MKKLVFLIFACFALSVAGFADKKPKKKELKKQEADTVLVVTTDTVRLNVADSLQQCADSLLKELKSFDRIQTPNLNTFTAGLIESDTADESSDIIEKFEEHVITDLRSMPLADDSSLRQLENYREAKHKIQQIEQALSVAYDASEIEKAKQKLGELKRQKLIGRQTKQVEQLSNGFKNYKWTFMRVGDIIESIYALKDSATFNDNMYDEIMNFQRRNRFINYVPYAAKLRQRVVDAIPFDEQHVRFEQTQWDAIEAVKQEIEIILKKIEENNPKKNRRK